MPGDERVNEGESTNDALLPDSHKRFLRIHELLRADFGSITVNRMEARLLPALR